MAKRLLLDVLIKVLGEYIELSEENFDLNLAVWSGQIVLHNLKLKTESLLRNFNLSIVHGSIKTLEIIIPWTALLNSPVKIMIDGVYLQVGPINVAFLDKEETRKRVMQLKQEKLKLADKVLDFGNDPGGAGGSTAPSQEAESSNSKDQTSVTYVQAITSKIVDNLEITLLNIHARLEDSQTIPGITYAAGVTLSSFTLSTCDENWVESFVARAVNSVIHKLAKVENLGIYWNTDSNALAGLEFPEWLKAMHRLIHDEEEGSSSSSSGSSSRPSSPTSKSSPVNVRRAAAVTTAAASSTLNSSNSKHRATEYILVPTNKLAIKLIHNEKSLPSSMSSVPKYDISVDCTNLELSLDGLQYRQLHTTLEMIGAVERKRQPYSYKPLNRPTTPATARAWWIYACKLAIKRPRYIKLVKLSKTPSPANAYEDSLGASERIEMQDLEERLPLNTLIIFRHMAAREMTEENQRRLLAIASTSTSASPSSSSPAKSIIKKPDRTWVGWLAGEGNTASKSTDDSKITPSISSVKQTAGTPEALAAIDESTEIPLASILQAFEESNKKAIESIHAVFLCLRLKSSATLELSMYRCPIARANMSLSAVAEVSNSGVTATVALTEILAIDRCTLTPSIANIITVKQTLATTPRVSSAEALNAPVSSAQKATVIKSFAGNGQKNSKPDFSVVIESQNGKSTVRISALPLQFALNKICVQHLIGIFYWSNPNANTVNPAAGTVSEAAAAATAAAERIRKSEQDKSRAATPQKEREEERRTKVPIRDDAFEFIFEAHAPKIIVPEDSSADKGYLLLDSGYLKVRGFLGQDGMQWTISLNDVNAGMPLTVNDMYTFRESGALYLIKPFDIVAVIQNIDKSTSDISVDVDIKPELRGELDKTKLSRLLHVLRVISDMFFMHPDILADSIIPASTLYLPIHQKLLLQHSHLFQPNVDIARRMARLQVNSNTRATTQAPTHSDNGSTPGPDNASGNDAAEAEEESFPEIIKAIEVKAMPAVQIDVNRVKVDLIIRMPVVALDLTYDAAGGNNLVFEVRTLVTRMKLRAFDMHVAFDLSELSIEDSLRCLSQRDLARTPSTGPNLIHIAYTYNYNVLSPYYKKHATEVVVNFANLGLNLDVITIMHLRPFMEVLLQRRAPPPVRVQEQPSTDATTSPESFTTPSKDALRPAAAPVHAPLSGMHFIFTLEKVSLDILRPSESGKKEEELESAFSLQIAGLRADLDMQELTKADVRLRTIEIVDIRSISRDYAIKRVFCPVFDIEEGGTAPASGEDANDLLHLTYYQDSKHLSYLKLMLLNMSCFVSFDTILDLTAVASANFWAILELVAAPPLLPPLSSMPPPLLSTPESITQPLVEEEDADTVASTTSPAAEIVSPAPSLNFLTPPSSPLPLSRSGIKSTSSKIKRVEEKEEEEFAAHEEEEDDLSPTLLHLDADIDAGSATKKEPDPSLFTDFCMIVSINAVNPRLVLVDDPTTEESQAIVGRCGIEIHWTRDTKVGPDSRYLRESFHMSMKSLEVFVLRNMLNWSPQPILEPIGVEYYMRRESLNGKVVKSTVSIGTDNANARVSIHDLALSQSIFLRRSPIDANVKATPPAASASAPAPPFDEENSQLVVVSSSLTPPPTPTTVSSSNNSPVPSPSYTFSVNLGMISLVAVNDFNGQNVPVARVLLEDTKFCIVRNDTQIHGEGDLFASADFYNSVLSLWEPILDRWHPTLAITTGEEGRVYDVKSDHTMQITISGIMLETLMQTYSLLMRVDETVERELVPDIVVDNLLGDSLDLELFDSASGTKLLTLSTGIAAAVPRVKDIENLAYANGTHMPTAVNVQFLGTFGDERLPLYNLPFNINKPRAYHLQTKDDEQHDGNNGSAAGTVATRRPPRMIVIEPIVEEVYENSRYDPMAGRWRQPFLLGDPFEWTDASGSVRKDISSIKLTSDRWEWQDTWGVDMHGMVGEEFDEDGWEYSTAFGSFSIASFRRNKMPMDCVRRRRWTRTRVPTAASFEERFRPLSLFWDVKPLKNGAKKVLIRSGMQVANLMPFSIVVALSNSAWENVREFGPIKEGETFCVPLLCSYATGICVRPSDFPYNWSKKTSCSIQAYDFRSARDLICEGAELSPVCIRILSKQVHKSLLVSFIPYIVIRNRLPCDMQFKCTSNDNKQEAGELLSGASSKLAYMNLSSWPKLSITMGTKFPWSSPIVLDTSSTKPRIVELPSLQGGSSDGLVITVTCVIGAGHNMEVDIYSKSVVIDRTGLGISIWSQKRLGEVMMRHTFVPTTTSPIGRKIVPTSVKKRLKVLASKAVKHLNLHNKPKNRNITLSTVEGHDVDEDDDVSSEVSVSSSLVSFKEAGGGRRRSSSSQIFESEEPADSDDVELGYAVQEIPQSEFLGSGQDGSGGRSGLATDVETKDTVSGIIKNFAFESKSVYLVTTATIGNLVYTDSSFTWSFIPQQLRGHAFIRTANDDKWRRSKVLLRFNVGQPALVLLLVDMRVNKYFKWLQEDGYHRVVDQAIARRVQKGSLQEIHFAIYGKYLAKGEEIVLGGNWCKEVTTMYTVFVVPAEAFDVKAPRPSGFPTLDNRTTNNYSLLDQVTFEERYQRQAIGKAWMEGGNGMCMLYAGDDVIAVGLKQGTAWSEDIRISMTSSSLKGSFEVVDWDTLRAYQLSYQMQYMPGLFTNTQQITITPRYCIVNLMDEELMVVQRGSREIVTYRPYVAEGWHKSDINLSTSVQLRCRSSLWSLGTIDINEIGNSVLHLPTNRSSAAGSNHSAIVLHVEVKVAEPTDFCSVVVIVWRASVETSSDISIRNDTNAHVTVMQADIELAQSLRESRLFEVCVPPGAWVPFGWADPDRDCNVLVTVGTTLLGPRKRIAKVSMLKAGELLRLPDNSGRTGPTGEVILSVLAENGGRVLRISRRSNEEYAMQLARERAESKAMNAEAYAIHFFLSSLGVSLVVEKPVRREFLSLYVDGLEGRYKTNGTIKSYEFIVMDLQIDNYSETVINSVLLYCVKEIKEKKEGQGEEGEDGKEASTQAGGDPSGNGDGEEEEVDESETPVIQLTIVQEVPVGTSTPIFRYVAFRVLALSLEVDSATLQLLFTDLLNDLKYVSREQALALSSPTEWMDENNKLLASPEHHLKIVDVYRSKMAALTSKMYFEKLILHPMKITFTFVQAPFPRKGSSNPSLQSTAFNIFTSLAAVDRMQLKLKSFEVEDALESDASLKNHIINKTLQDLQSQLAQIAGSLAVLGSPMGFARKVGGGVKDFFYEPYQGAVHSPKEFVVGLGKGTSSFFTNFVAGAMNSTVAFAGTASKGIGYLSGDGEYVRKRAIKRQRSRANRGGIMDGIMDGGESVMSGFTSGMSGLVTRPFEEARKTGASGFLKGIGLGLLGALIKPVMGLTDGAASVASGISNQVGKERLYVNVRPARALERSEADSTDLVVAPLNLKAAYAQEFVIKRSKKMSYDDAYLNYIIIVEETGDEAIILSEMYVYWRRAKSLWGRTWANISHCVFQGDSIGIMLYARTNNALNGTAVPESVSIPCYSREKALELYAVLALNSHRMGNPSNVIPVVEVSQELWLTDEAFRNSIFARRGNAANLENELDGYRFGTANFEKLPKFHGNEQDVLSRIERSLELGYRDWKELDEKIWNLLWEWDCTHKGLNASRCSATIVINRSDSPIQITRIQMVHGRNVVIMGSSATGYEVESRSIMPNGSALIFIWAFLPSPIEIGHLKANINTAAFSATVASTQRESCCEGKGGFTCGFIEKTVYEWTSRFVIVIS